MPKMAASRPILLACCELVGLTALKIEVRAAIKLHRQMLRYLSMRGIDEIGNHCPVRLLGPGREENRCHI
jgi:hypothetical protein